MIRFVDLNNGSVYNGDIPYIHWFDDDQSVNLNYVKKLCIACEYEEIKVNLQDNDNPLSCAFYVALTVFP